MLFTISSSNSGEDGEAGEGDGKGQGAEEEEGEEGQGREEDGVEEWEDDERGDGVDEEEEEGAWVREGTSTSLPLRVTASVDFINTPSNADTQQTAYHAPGGGHQSAIVDVKCDLDIPSLDRA
jgi:hypothetical protein